MAGRGFRCIIPFGSLVAAHLNGGPSDAREVANIAGMDHRLGNELYGHMVT